MIVPKDWGFEDVAYNKEYCLKRMFVREQHRSSVHKHEIKDEVLMIGSGGLVYFETGTEPDNLTGNWMEEHDRIHIKPGLWHRFTALRDSTIYESSTHHEDSDSIRWVKGGEVDAQESRNLLQSFFKDRNQSNILKVVDAGVIAEQLHKQGKTVGMVNGCFDLLHPGHLAFLSQARERCEVLFVACNSDRAVKLMKGNNRPFIPESGRLASLAATRFVDYVVFVDDITCVSVVDAIRPNVYMTTSEYAKDGKLSGPEAVEADKLGATLDIIDLIPGYNTTAISAKFKK